MRGLANVTRHRHDDSSRGERRLSHWKGRAPVIGALLLSLCTLSIASASVASAHATMGSPAGTLYNSIPSPFPGNEPSLGYEATSTSEFGDQVAFQAGTSRALGTVTVTMSSWGCESGNWFNNNCSTTPGSTFSEPITFNIYNVGPSNTVGSLIATATQTFNIPFRPSASASCTGAQAGEWYDAAVASCFNGLATNVTFDFSSQNVTLPSAVIYGVAYNTSDYGYSPYGDATACHATAEGCGYDSLNVGVSCSTVNAGAGCPADNVTAGSDVDPTTAYLNSTWTGAYCDNGTAGTGTFRLDSPTNGCWSPYTPSVEFSPKGWPANVIGPSQPRGFSTQGFYIGVTGDGHWTLEVAQPQKNPSHIYAGTIHINGSAGFFTNVLAIQLEKSQGDTFSVSGRTIKFSFNDYGDIDGIRFTTSPLTNSITFTLSINGHPASATQIFLGSHKTAAPNGSPLTITR